jgi:1-acyl-sn-glycerol-3-phosphate acyltransferase
MRWNLLRSLAAVLAGIAMTGYCCVALIYRSWRKTLTRTQVDVIAKLWSSFILARLEARYTVYGRERLVFKDGTPYIFMSNHLSLMDIILANDAFLPGLRFIGKKEVTRYPLLGRAMRAGEYILIDRHNLANAKEDLALAKKKLQSGIKIWMFPEGTRGPKSDLLPFKKGGFHMAIELGATIIPVGLRDVEFMGASLWQGCIFGSQATIRVGEPIDASTYTKDELAALINRTRDAVHELVYSPSP